MYKSGLNITRIMLRNRGPATEVSINMDVLTTIDDAEESVERRHVPEVIQSDELPKNIQNAISLVFELLTTRANVQQGITKES